MNSSRVIIAPKEYHNYLRQIARRDDIFSNPKIFTREEIVDAYFGNIDSDYVFDLLKANSYSYEFIKKIISFLPLIEKANSKKENELKQLFEDAKSENFVEYNQYLFEFLKRGVDVYVYHDDRILKYIFEKCKIDDVKNVDLNTNKIESPLMLFKNEREEAHFVINKILDLVNSGVDINNILIYGIDASNSYYLNYFSHKYNLHINGLELGNYYTSFYYKKFKSILLTSGTIETALEDTDKMFLLDGDDYIKFKNLIVENYHDDLSLATNIEVFDSVMRETTINSKKCTNSPYILKNSELLQGKYIFVMDFNNKKYPSLKTDKDYIDDSIKSSNFVLTSTETNVYRKKILLDFLSLKNHYFYTFSKTGIAGKKYISYLKNELNLNEKFVDFMPYDYSKDMARYSLSMMKDVLVKYNDKNVLYDSYSEQIDNPNYAKYDNEVDPIEVYKPNEKLTLSYTSVDNYEGCPFKYLVSRIFKIQDDGDTLDLRIGNLVHKSFELSYKNHLEFKENFKTAFEELEFDAVEIEFLKSLYPKILEAYNFSIDQLHACSDPKIYLEKQVECQIDENTMLSGSIDKAIITENKYLFLLDYKTGSSENKFNYKDVEKLNKMQLPTYLLTATVDPDLKLYEIKGLYYDNIFMKDYNACDKYDHKYIGVSTFDSACLATFDEVVDGVGTYVKNFKVSLSSPNDSFVDDIYFEKMKDITKQYYKEKVDHLRSNDFSINPESKNCDNCSYHDICFYKKQYDTDEEDD